MRDYRQIHSDLCEMANRAARRAADLHELIYRNHSNALDYLQDEERANDFARDCREFAVEVYYREVQSYK